MRKYVLEFLANSILIIFSIIQQYHLLGYVSVAFLSNVIMFHEYVFKMIKSLFDKYLAKGVKIVSKYVSKWIKFLFGVLSEEVKKHYFIYSVIGMIIASSTYIIFSYTPNDKIFGVGQGILGGIPIMIGQLLIEKERERKAEKEKRENTKELLKRFKPHVKEHLDELLSLERIEYEKIAKFDSLVKEFIDSNLTLLDRETKDIFLSLSNHDFIYNLEKWRNKYPICCVNTGISLLFEKKFDYIVDLTESEIKKCYSDYIEKMKLLLGEYWTSRESTGRMELKRTSEDIFR